MVTDFAKEGDEDQEVAVHLFLYIVNRPTGCAGKPLDVDSGAVAGLAHYHDVHGFLIAEGKASVTAQPMQHRENVKLGGQVGVVCCHTSPFSEILRNHTQCIAMLDRRLSHNSLQALFSLSSSRYPDRRRMLDNHREW